MKLRTILMVLASVIINTAQLNAQTTDCAKQREYKPENDCSPCTIDTKYTVIVQNFLELTEISKMEEELNRMVESADAMYKTYGNLKQRYFNVLDLNLKKHFGEMEKNPEEAKRLISWMEGILKDGGCVKTNAFDTRSSGVSDGALQDITSNLSDAMRNISAAYYNSTPQLTFDCCQDPKWQPGDIFITNSQQIHNQFMRFKSMFENFKLLQQVQMNAIQFSALQFQKYDQDAKEKMERLVNNDFFSVLSGLMGQSGLMTTAQAAALNTIIKNYKANKDKTSAVNAIRQLLGDDAAQVYGFMFDNYTAEELLGSFGDLIKSNPAKFRSIQKLAGLSKVTGALSGFLNLVQIAESSVNIFFDTFLKLGGNSFVIRTQNELWCVTATYYYYALQSLLSNAGILYKLRSSLEGIKRAFPNTTIPMPGLDSLSAANAQQTIAKTFGINTKGTMQGNQYTVELPGGQQVIFVFGKYFCGKMKNYDKPETTPDPKIKKISTAIPGYGEEEEEDKNTWYGGFICGTGYNSGNTARPFFTGMNENGFVQQHQTELNSGFGGNVLAKGNEIKIMSFPTAQAGIGFGCAVNHRFNIHAEIIGGWQQFKAVTEVTVAKTVFDTTSTAPPTTKQATEQITAGTSNSFFKINLGPQVKFGDRVEGYIGAGFIAGYSSTGKINYTAGEKTFKETKKQTVLYAGAYVNAGINIPICNLLSVKVEGETSMISVKKNFIVNPGLSAGLIIWF